MSNVEAIPEVVYVAGVDTGRYTMKIDLAVDTLRQAIIEGDLPPGSRLRQEDLAQRFGISSTPIREALRRLQAEGLVITEPHKGSRVATSDPVLSREIYTIRILLEGLATRQAAAKMTPAILRQLEATQRHMRQAVPTGNTRAMRKANQDFHLAIYEHAGPVLNGLVQGLMARSPYISLWINPDRAVRSVQEHECILEALRAKDPDRAEQAMREHLTGVLEYMTEAESAK